MARRKKRDTRSRDRYCAGQEPAVSSPAAPERKPVVAVLNTNPRVIIDEELDRYADRLELLRPPPTDTVPAAQAAELLPDADACVTCWNSPQLTAELLAVAPRLRIIAHAAGTLRPYLSDAVWARDIAVVNAAGAIGEAVAHYTVALIVIGRRGLMQLAPQAAAGKWRDAELYRPTADVRGITVGVVGAGEAGRRVISLLQHYRVRVLVSDPLVDAAAARALGAESVALDQLFASSDVVTLHAPNNEHTRHLVNAERLAAMPDGAIFINTARGPLVDEQALVAELQRRRIWAFLDVTDPEPPAADSPLLACPNLTLSPHVAGYSSGRYQLSWVLDEVVRFFAGEPLQHRQTRAMVEMSSFR